MPSSRGSSDPGIKPIPLKSPALAGGFFTTSTPGEGPTPFQTLLILAPERLFLKPNFHRPYLTESEVSLRERQVSQFPRPTSYCSPAFSSSPFRPQCHQLFPVPVSFRFFFFLSLSFILLLLLFPPPNPPLLLLVLFCLILLLHLLFLLSVHMLSGAHKGVGHLFYFGVFLINRGRPFQQFSSSAYLDWRQLSGSGSVNLDKGSGGHRAVAKERTS